MIFGGRECVLLIFEKKAVRVCRSWWGVTALYGSGGGNAKARQFLSQSPFLVGSGWTPLLKLVWVWGGVGV